MGLDNIEVRCPLPDDAPSWLKASPHFQTHDLGNGYSDYLITESGELQMARHVLTGVLMEAFRTTTEPPPFPLIYKRKRLELYATNLTGGRLVGKQYRSFTKSGEDREDITYIVQIRDGRVSSIKQRYRKTEPALPMEKF